LLLEPHTGRQDGRIHDGKVMVMRSNLRWCSDGLEFACWNGEVIRTAFIIDAFDREIIAWTAATASAASFFCRLTKGFTQAGAISRTWRIASASLVFWLINPSFSLPWNEDEPGRELSSASESGSNLQPKVFGGLTPARTVA